MGGWLKVLCLVCFLVIAGAGSVKGKGACGRLSPDQEAVQLAPCAVAARDGKAPVSKSCCLQVKRSGRIPGASALFCSLMRLRRLASSHKLLSQSPNAVVSLIVPWDISVDLTPYLSWRDQKFEAKWGITLE
ncbi:UNVERIFIED_CONTAM: hypothetical protein Sradi_5935200 [Sesamum radiatum]|uniref:Bifunctional inhibitor/plant lipid transfer protein/seed storage helical domain-containing protein n=1 Tax=Sesamum radiatum TaxID=300843 RepID=A0AAW2KSA3_SESRA